MSRITCSFLCIGPYALFYDMAMDEDSKKITHVVISHVSNPEIAELLKSKITVIMPKKAA